MQLPSVPLTPPDVNLMAHPQVLIHTLRRLEGFFRSFGISWYVQSSLAAVIHGVPERNVTDIDVRADWDIHDLYAKVQQHLEGGARLRKPVSYSRGEFRNHCIILNIESPETHIDITTEIKTYRDGVLLGVPFDGMAQPMQVHPQYEDTFPVCSLEYLLIYKLVNSRDRTERKNDLAESALLLKKLAAKWRRLEPTRPPRSPRPR
jgi:hypothetical protein